MDNKKAHKQCTVVNIDQHIITSKNASISEQIHELLYHLGNERQVGHNGIVYLQGDVGCEGYIVKEGKLDVIKTINGQKKVIASLGPGQLFGELAFFKDVKRNVTVQANGKATIINISRRRVQEAIISNSELAIFFLNLLAEKYLHDDLATY